MLNRQEIALQAQEYERRREECLAKAEAHRKAQAQCIDDANANGGAYLALVEILKQMDLKPAEKIQDKVAADIFASGLQSDSKDRPEEKGTDDKVTNIQPSADQVTAALSKAGARRKARAQLAERATTPPVTIPAENVKPMTRRRDKAKSA